MYESVNVLGGVIRVDSVPLCLLIACGAGRLNFSPTFLHILSAIKLTKTVRRVSSSFIVVCLLGLKFHNLGRKTQRKPENTVYLSTFTVFLWYPTVNQTPSLFIQTVFFCCLSEFSTQKNGILVML